MSDILIGKGSQQVWLQGRYANRHGMVAGATGTDKCVHSSRPEGRARRGRNLRAQPVARRARSHQDARGRRGAGVDRESAYEILKAQAEEGARQAEREAVAEKPAKSRRSNRQGAGEAFFKSTVRTIGTSLGREIFRGLMGVMFKGRR